MRKPGLTWSIAQRGHTSPQAAATTARGRRDIIAWRRVLLRLALIYPLAFAAGCRHDNPYFCEGAPHNNCLALDASHSCQSDQDCDAPTAVCDLATHVCVQCTTNDHASCPSQQPVCSDTNACRACAAHTECPSQACLPDGSCGTDTNVAYVDPMGTDNDMCTMAMPCTKVSAALATTRPFVKFHSTTDEQVSINAQNVTLLADPGAKLTSTTNGLLLEVKGSSQVAIYDLEITGASGATGTGISLPPGNTATLMLQRAKVTNNAAGGIAISGGTVTVNRTEVSVNNAGGIQMTAAGVVTLTNNFIHHNGNNITAGFGGLSLQPMAGSTVQFNTIVDNQANSGAASAGGLFCDVAGFVAGDNLIFRNTGGQSAATQTFGNCTYGNSFVLAASPGDNTPQFVHPNALPFDYHLTAATPATIRDAAGTCTGVDYDGDTRPVGPACDLGADEYRP